MNLRSARAWVLTESEWSLLSQTAGALSTIWLRAGNVPDLILAQGWSVVVCLAFCVSLIKLYDAWLQEEQNAVPRFIHQLSHIEHPSVWWIARQLTPLGRRAHIHTFIALIADLQQTNPCNWMLKHRASRPWRWLARDWLPEYMAWWSTQSSAWPLFQSWHRIVGDINDPELLFLTDRIIWTSEPASTALTGHQSIRSFPTLRLWLTETLAWTGATSQRLHSSRSVSRQRMNHNTNRGRCPSYLSWPRRLFSFLLSLFRWLLASDHLTTSSLPGNNASIASGYPLACLWIQRRRRNFHSSHCIVIDAANAPSPLPHHPVGDWRSGILRTYVRCAPLLFGDRTPQTALDKTRNENPSQRLLLHNTKPSWLHESFVTGAIRAREALHRTA